MAVQHTLVGRGRRTVQLQTHTHFPAPICASTYQVYIYPVDVDYTGFGVKSAAIQQDRSGIQPFVIGVNMSRSVLRNIHAYV